MLHTLRTRRSASSTAMRKTKVLMTSARRWNHFHVPSVLIIFTAHRPDGTDTECASDVPHPAPCSYLLFQPRPFVREGSGHQFSQRSSKSLQSSKLRETFPRIFLSLTLAAVRESFPVRRDAQPRTQPVNDPPRSQISYNPQLPSPMGVQGAPVSVSFFLRFISIRSGAWFN